MQQGVNHDFIGFRLGLAARRFLPDDFLQIGTAALDGLGDHLLGALQRKAFRQDNFEFGLLIVLLHIFPFWLNGKQAT